MDESSGLICPLKEQDKRKFEMNLKLDEGIPWRMPKFQKKVLSYYLSFFHQVGVQPVQLPIVDGSKLSVAYFSAYPFTHPFIVQDRSTLGITYPANLSFSQLHHWIPPYMKLPGYEVVKQQVLPEDSPWTYHVLQCQLLHLAPEDRSIVINVISLEVSGTALGKEISPPNIVQEMDWTLNGVWPSEWIRSQPAYNQADINAHNEVNYKVLFFDFVEL